MMNITRAEFTQVYILEPSPAYLRKYQEAVLA